MANEDLPQTLIGISFDDSYRASEFLLAARRLASNKSISLVDAVIVTKSEQGRVVVQETTDPSPGRSAVSGAMWAGVFGLILGGPVGWLAGAAIGAGTGAVTAKVIDTGIPDEWVNWFREAVAAGTTTVALLVTEFDREALVAEVQRFAGAKLIYSNLDQATFERVRTALGMVAEPPVSEPVEPTVAEPPAEPV